jgi:hypothetical protein
MVDQPAKEFEMGDEAVVTAPRKIRFMAINRGIVVGSLYGGASLVATLLMFRRVGSEVLALTAVLGFVAGAIVGFSNLPADASTRDLKVSTTDALMVSVWAAILSLAANLAGIRLRPESLYLAIGCFAVAALVGSAAGVPALGFLSKLSVKGRRPFRFIIDATGKIENEDVRFVTRVVLQSLVFAALVALAATVIAVVIGLIILYLIISVFTSDEAKGRRQQGGGLSNSQGSRPPPRTTSVPKHGFIREDGRVTKEGLLTSTPTGQRVDADGRVLEEGLLTDRPTGMRIDQDGRVLRQGLLSDTPTGVKFVPDGLGGSKVVKEGLLTDRDIGMRLSDTGRAQEQGVVGRHDASLEIAPDGTVLGDGKKKS